MNKHLLCIAYSKSFPLFYIFRIRTEIREYIITSGSHLQASFFHYPLRLHGVCSWQFPPGRNHMAAEVQHCLNKSFCSRILAVQYLLSFYLEVRLLASQLEAQQREIFCLKKCHVNTERTMVNSEFKAFLKNKIYAHTLKYRNSSNCAKF